MNDQFEIFSMRNEKDLLEIAAEWFHEKWNVPSLAYRESIRDCQRDSGQIPQWYLVRCGNKTIGGLGVIENDFHKRRDLTPNICALYVEEGYRNLGIAKKLLKFVCGDLSAMGYQDVYLITEHIGFYEKCGWEFLCVAEEEDGRLTRLYHTSLGEHI